MTNAQILRKAIEKTVNNGWVWSNWNREYTLIIWNVYNCELAICRGDYYFVIFSPSFAKAYWGEKEITVNLKEGFSGFPYLVDMLRWKYHQHKLLDEVQSGRNPLKYIEKFLEV